MAVRFRIVLRERLHVWHKRRVLSRQQGFYERLFIVCVRKADVKMFGSAHIFLKGVSHDL